MSGNRWTLEHPHYAGQDDMTILILAAVVVTTGLVALAEALVGPLNEWFED